MILLRNVPAEILGLAVLVTLASMKISFPEVSDFWFALATAITLFLIMQIRTHFVLETDAKEKPSP